MVIVEEVRQVAFLIRSGRAFWGAIVVGVVSWLISLAIPDRKQESDG